MRPFALAGFGLSGIRSGGTVRARNCSRERAGDPRFACPPACTGTGPGMRARARARSLRRGGSKGGRTWGRPAAHMSARPDVRRAPSQLVRRRAG